MTKAIIQVENLGKKYLIGHSRKEKYIALRDVLFKSAKQTKNMVLRPSKRGSSYKEDFWALQNISFEIEQGDRVGIIGRNGAGKSTLLKLLSRITEPTTGQFTLRGRVASLLEVGTGFHPELTGRENIFLNGAILGMSKTEISRKFDEIVSFAEVERFLDTPVKRYSSGMYVRLAFAVAAHVDTEILIVDEVLAVGDAAFQKKCLSRMGDLSNDGRTLLFVSHNMGVLRELVNQCILLEEGEIVSAGSVDETISKYLSSGRQINDLSIDLSDHRNRLAGMKRILRSVSVRNSEGEYQKDFSQLEKISVHIEYKSDEPDTFLAGAGFILYTAEGVRVGGYNTYMAFPPPHKIQKDGTIIFRILPKQLTPGTYLLTVSLGSHQGALEDKIEQCIDFTVYPADIYRTGYLLTKEDGVAVLSVEVCMADEPDRRYVSKNNN